MIIEENVLLAPHTSFKIGGPAKKFVEIKSIEEAFEVFRSSELKDLPVFVLGEGTNVLIGDEGFDGLAIKNSIKGFSFHRTDSFTMVTVFGGESWDGFVSACVASNLAGVENLSGIPGTVGAAPIQNIGAYGQSVSDVIEEILVIDRLTGARLSLKKEECGFGYRNSIFKSCPKRYFIVTVVFKLWPYVKPNLDYQDLKKAFAKRDSITIGEMRSAVLGIRERKGALILFGFLGFNSAGSFFKNPIVDYDLFRRVQIQVELFRFKNEMLSNEWFWKLSDGRVKIFAASLIECAGFSRGSCLGQAGISSRHALVLVNLGKAKAKDIVTLAQLIQYSVKTNFGVWLEPEIELVGFKENPLFKS
ncbi:MAG: UDP-N-acetylmuramate dehydrogenase [Parcubacteria group bacterium]|nr:UDP-N-acetylmuramate dehydrogenase [Parcubacteria group bacterium]